MLTNSVTLQLMAMNTDFLTTMTIIWEVFPVPLALMKPVVYVICTHFAYFWPQCILLTRHAAVGLWMKVELERIL